MSQFDKIFIYGFLLTLLGILYVTGYLFRDYKHRYLRDKRIQRLNWKKVSKVFAIITGFCLMGSIDNKMFSWYEAPLIGFIITSLVLYTGIFRPDDSGDELKQFNNPEFKVYEKVHKRNNKIKDILK